MPELRLPAEPSITINGTPLTPAQAMTVRVAIGTLSEVLAAKILDKNTSLPQSLRDGYQKRIKEIWKMMGLL
jgi:hypothetical protein